MSRHYKTRGDPYLDDQGDTKKERKKKCLSLWFILPCCYCISTAIFLALGIPFAYYVHSLYFDCAVDPPDHGGLHRIWDNESRHAGTAVNYMCEEKMTDDIVLTHVCSYGNWTMTLENSKICEELRNRRECADDPPPATKDQPSDWNKWSRNAGKKINYKCSTALDAPIYKTVVCDGKTLKWEVFSNKPENCFCGQPVVYSPPMISDWDGSSLEMGTTVTYECKTNLGRKVFQVITCSNSAKWQVIETGSCFFFVHFFMNFTNAAEYCKQLGTEMLFIENDGEQEQVKSLLSSDVNFNEKCRTKAFLGFRENVNKQWETDDRILVSGTSDLWGVNDEGRETCVVMNRANGYRFTNELCQMGFCYVCEVDSKSTKVECPVNKTCYVIGGDEGDHRFAENRCIGMNGQLARIVNIDIMETVKDMILKDPLLENCPGFYVGIMSKKRHYERLNGQQITYQRFGDEQARSMTRHCAILDAAINYDWMDETCTFNSCFMCKAIGFPLQHTVESGIKYQLNAAILEIIAMEEANMKRRRRRRLALNCREGWAFVDDHCVFFNTSAVAHRDANELCEISGGELAPNWNSNLYLFIARAIYLHSDPQRRPLWHVGSPNCTAKTCTKTTSCYTLDAFSGRVGAAPSNCQLKAPFVCSDKV